MKQTFKTKEKRYYSYLPFKQTYVPTLKILIKKKVLFNKNKLNNTYIYFNVINQIYIT